MGQFETRKSFKEYSIPISKFLKAVACLTVSCFVWLFVIALSFLFISVFFSATPVGEQIELWWVNPKEGTHLVLLHKEYKGLVEKELVKKVIGIAPIPEGFLVQSQNGDAFVVSKAADVRALSQGEFDTLSETVSLRKPGDLLTMLILKKFWWLFAIEVGLAILTCYLIVRKPGSKRQQPPPLPQ